MVSSRSQSFIVRHANNRTLNQPRSSTNRPTSLSQQHLREFELADIEAEIFDKDARPDFFRKQPVEILEVTRLRDESGEKTVALEAFEGNNLVLVDEGHRGASGGEDGAWMKARNALCEKGFSFEYSATFQQAVAGKPKLIELSGKNILFNYSYRYFYADGFGKEDRVRAHMFVCFLSFVLWKTLGQQCKRAGLGDEPRRVISELSEIRLVDVVLPTDTGREIRNRCVARPTEHQRILLDKLGLRLPTRIREGKM